MMIQYIADAFTDRLFAGNPAAVLPCREMPSPDLMQAIAIENNYSETAFVVKRGKGDYDLKWFTPGGEVALCGHATLATSFVLHRFIDKDVEEMHFHTLSGELIVRPCAYGYTMDFPAGAYKAVPLTEEILAATGGLALEAFYDGGDMMVVVGSEEDLAAMVPDYDAMRQIEGRGLIITAVSKEFDFVSRCFYPKLNVPEDPVTGSAHTYLTPFWAGKLGKTEMVAKQLSPRGGLLRVRIEGERVFITGNAVLFMKGEIPFDL
ncbi:MAG: PhzF family phenazine biosynthesis protein [Bacteroidales bacterium]|nr:PhzF family phenazine biosynthesis protein [Bacteroidales bacterium]